MTRMTIKIAALAAFAAASPAAAQWAGGAVDIPSLRAEIDAGVARGDINGREAFSLRSQLRGLVDLQRRYAMDGLSWSERNDLQQRALGLRNEIQAAEGLASGYGRYDNRYDNSGRYRTYGNGYNNGYGTYGTPGNGQYRTYGDDRFGTYGNGTYNGGAYGSRTYNQGQYDQRQYDRGQYDRDDRYRDDRDDGDDRYGDDNGYTLRVGDRVSGGLYAVPDAYRYRFRDSGTFYYRYGGGNIYQIDARNSVVVRVIPVGR